MAYFCQKKKPRHSDLFFSFLFFFFRNDLQFLPPSIPSPSLLSFLSPSLPLPPPTPPTEGFLFQVVFLDCSGGPGTDPTPGEILVAGAESWLLPPTHTYTHTVPHVTFLMLDSRRSKEATLLRGRTQDPWGVAPYQW